MNTLHGRDRHQAPQLRGAVIVPAYNEAAHIERTLAPLSQAAADGLFELIVVCNGCEDDTAERARRFPGVEVVELDVGSKVLALNTGDQVATCWPRLYMDADIEITAPAVVAVLDRLRRGDVLAARPSAHEQCDDASPLVRSYYRARQKIAEGRNVLWGAGVYGLTEHGHQRFGVFPGVTGDDMFVDLQFDAQEKTVVETEPAVHRTPSDVSSLLAVLGRHRRGNAELMARDPTQAKRTDKATVAAVLRTVCGLRSAADAAVYIGMALAARWRARGMTAGWARDETSRRVRQHH